MIGEVKEDLKKILHHISEHGMWVMIGRFYLLGVSFLLSVALTRLMSLEDYGQYKFIFSVLAITAMFSLSATSEVMVRYVPRGYDEIYRKILNLKIIFSILGSISLLGFSIYNYLNNEIEMFFAFLFSALLFPIVQSFKLFESYLQAKINFKLLNILYAIRATFNIVAISSSIVFFETYLSAVLASLLSMALSNLVFYYYVRKIYQSDFSGKEISGRKNKLFKRQSIILTFFGALPILAENLDKILIGKLIGYESLAIFSIGILAGKVINSFGKLFITTINAKLVHKTLLIRHYLFLFLFGSLTGLLISIFIFPKFIEFVYGIEYTDSVMYGQIIVLSMGLHFFQVIYYNHALFNKKKSLRVIYLHNTITPLILLVTLLLFLYVPDNPDTQLFLLALLYPVKLIISPIVIFLLKPNIDNKGAVNF